MGVFEDFVNRELPRRSVMWTNLLTGYTGDPNDAGAPDEIKNTPAGGFYLRETDGSVWSKKTAAPGTWEQTEAPKSFVTYEVDPVLGDDDNDGITAPFKTLYRASQIVAGKYDVTVFLKAGDHRLHDFGDWFFDPEQPTWEGLGFGHDLNPVRLMGEVVTDETFTVLSVSDFYVTKDGSTPNWTPGEHAGKYIRYLAYGILEVQYPIVNNTATVLELSYDGVGEWALPVPTDSVEIVHNGAIIKPAPVRPTYSTNGFQARGMLEITNVDFDGEGNRFLLIDSYFNAPGFLRLKSCGFTDANNAVWSNGFLLVEGCHFSDLDLAIAAYSPDNRASFCSFNNCQTVMGAEGNGSQGTIPFFSSIKNCFRVFDIDDGGYLQLYNSRMKLDGVTHLAYVRKGSHFYDDTGMAFVSGFDSVSTYAFFIIGAGNTVALTGSASTALTAGSSYFYVNGVTLSLAAYLAAGADVEFPLNNSIGDV